MLAALSLPVARTGPSPCHPDSHVWHRVYRTGSVYPNTRSALCPAGPGQERGCTSYFLPSQLGDLVTCWMGAQQLQGPSSSQHRNLTRCVRVQGRGEPNGRSPLEGSSAPPHPTPIRVVSGHMQGCGCPFARPW